VYSSLQDTIDTFEATTDLIDELMAHSVIAIVVAINSGSGGCYCGR